jgi:PTS system mannose-specific IIA component
MIGLVIVTHGRLAEHFLAAMEHVVGPQERIETVSIGADDDMEKRRTDIISAAERVDDGAGVIILTDMFGGTPSNLAISMLDGKKIEALAGINLPMLVRLAKARSSETLRQAVLSAQEAGRKYIHVASTLLEEGHD